MSEAKRSRSATSGRQKSGGSGGISPQSVPNSINKSRRQAFFLFFLSFLRVVGGGVFLAGGLKGGGLGGHSHPGHDEGGHPSILFLFLSFLSKKSLLLKACFVISFFFSLFFSFLPAVLFAER